jgi:hypothetical protein
MLLPIFCSTHSPPTKAIWKRRCHGRGFEAMAAKQNRSEETQRLLGSSSLKLAF